MKLADAIGVEKNMTPDEVITKWNSSPDSIKNQAPSVGDSISALSTLQTAITTALNAYNAAVSALEVLKIVLGIPDAPVNAAANQVSASANNVNKTTDNIITTMQNTEVNV